MMKNNRFTSRRTRFRPPHNSPYRIFAARFFFARTPFKFRIDQNCPGQFLTILDVSFPARRSCYINVKKRRKKFLSTCIIYNVDYFILVYEKVSTFHFQLEEKKKRRKFLSTCIIYNILQKKYRFSYFRIIARSVV